MIKAFSALMALLTVERKSAASLETVTPYSREDAVSTDVPLLGCARSLE